MSALQTEDAASVLESFIHDTANLPAEIAHLLEEMAAKDEVLSQHRATISNADLTLQRHVKTKGQMAPQHPNEDILYRNAVDAYAQCNVLQDEKVALANKASLLLDRHVKRLDLKIRDLATDGALPHDPSLPSLLHPSDGNRVNPATSGASTGVNTPLHPHQQHPQMQAHSLALAHASAAGSSTHTANAAMAQMLNRVAHQNNMSASVAASVTAPAAAMQPHPLLGGGAHSGAGGAGGGNSGRHREMSVASDGKRRRLNGSLGPVGTAASGLARHSSLGPGTPKAGTPGLGAGTATSSRAGSVGPRTKKAGTKKVPPHMASGLARRRMGGAAVRGAMSKKSARRQAAGKKGSDSDEDDSSPSDEGSDEDNNSADAGVAGGNGAGPQGKDGAVDEDDAEMGGVDDEGEDTKLYCFCKRVSHGDMVACDNENCPVEWFHWLCVGLTSEPKGRWLCPDCKKLPEKKIKFAR